jgi:hypothetical protein
MKLREVATGLIFLAYLAAVSFVAVAGPTTVQTEPVGYAAE